MTGIKLFAAAMTCAAALAVPRGPSPLVTGGAPAAPAVDAAGASDAQQAAWQDVIRNLRHPDVKVRLGAVESLGNAGFLAAAEPVAPLINDPDNRVQYAAIDAELTFFLVEAIGGRTILSFSGSRSRAQEAFDAGPLVRAATPAPPAVVDALLAAIRDDNDRIRFDAAHAVGFIAEAPLTAAQTRLIIDGLDHYDPVIRATVARVIGRLRVKEATDKLVTGLNDSSLIVRRYSTEALGLIREVRATTALLALFSHYGKGDLAAETLLALARIGDGAAKGVYRVRLSDGNAGMRRAAAEGLGRLGDRDSLDALQLMMKTDKSATVRLAATYAVGQMGESQSHLIAGALAVTETAAQARDYLLEIGGAALPGVTSALGVATKDARYRATLVHLVGFVGTKDSIALVEPYLKDKDERVSRAAANAIARLNR